MNKMNDEMSDNGGFGPDDYNPCADDPNIMVVKSIKDENNKTTGFDLIKGGSKQGGSLTMNFHHDEFNPTNHKEEGKHDGHIIKQEPGMPPRKIIPASSKNF